jgi:hypothetical protein
MSFVLPALLAAVAVFSAFYFHSQTSTRRSFSTKDRLDYIKWKTEFGRLYATPAEDNFRMGVFIDQRDFVSQSNENYNSKMLERGKVLSEPMFALNQFGDLTDEEFTSMYTGLSQKSSSLPLVELPKNLLRSSHKHRRLQQNPSQFELRIRAQGSCGSCWAFSTILMTEKHYFDEHRTQLDFSQQELVDCDQGNDGCVGGTPEIAINYLIEHGIALASEYPYITSAGACRRDQTSRVTVNVKPMKELYPFHIKAAASIVEAGGIAGIAVYSTGKFRYLTNSSEPYDASIGGECGKLVNHAINLHEANPDTMVVNVINSWGTKWAVKGTKKIKVCSEENVLGEHGRIMTVLGDEDDE